MSVEWFLSLRYRLRKNRVEKYWRKISAENRKIKPLPIETMGRGFLVSGCGCVEHIIVGHSYA